MDLIKSSYRLLLILLFSGPLTSGLLAQGKFFKFPITEEGVYKVTAGQASELGASTVEELSIYGYEGMLPQVLDSSFLNLKEIPVKEINGDLYFFLSAAPTIEMREDMVDYQTHYYTDTLYYLVETHRKHTTTIPSSNSPIGANPAQGILYQAKPYKNEKYNVLSSGRKWYGERVFNGETITLNFPEKSSLGLPIYYQGRLMSQSLTESTFRVTINQFLDETIPYPAISNSRYAIKGIENQRAGFTSEPLRQEDIQVKLHFQTSDRNGIGYLDYFMIGIPFPSTDLPSGIYYNFSGKEMWVKPTQLQWTWDISDFFEVKELNSTDQYLFNSHKIAVFTPEEAKTIRDWKQVSLHLRDQPKYAELIIIAPPLLHAEAERLAAFKNSTGISTQVISLPEVYDSFGYGNTDITAIRNLLAFHYHRGKQIKNVLLFGKGTFDYKNILGGRPNLVPSYGSRSSLNPLTTYSSDDYFGFLNIGEGFWEESVGGDLKLGIGVGRLPVINIQEARNVVNKIIQYGTPENNPGDWKRKILFVADDGDNNIHLNDSELLAGHLSSNYPEFILEKLYLDSFEQTQDGPTQKSPSAKKTFHTLLDSSFLFVNYIGHGNETTLMSEEIFTVSDLNDWPENNRLPVFITATCEFGRQDSPLIRSGAEELLIAKNKGAIAMLSTGRPVFSSINFALNKAFIESVVAKKEGEYRTLGDIFKQTKNNSLNGPLNRNFSLLGDPSLKLALPELSAKSDGFLDMALNLEVDTLKAQQEIRYKGKIIDPLTGAGVETFNGSFEILLSDRPLQIQTLGDESNPVSYLDEQVQLHRGLGKVINGSFEGEFFVPYKLGNSIRKGTFRIFAQDSHTLEEAFGVETVVIGGTAVQQTKDNQGPFIQLSIPGSQDPLPTISSNSVRLLAALEDPSGINISTLNPDQNISLRINYGETINLNAFYKAHNGSYSQGVVDFPIIGLLDEGMNTLFLEVWDNVGNSSTKSMEIRVRGSLEVNILSHVTYPNPASTVSHFRLTHNRPGENLLLQVKIYSLGGSEIFFHSIRFPKANPLLENISWIFMQSKTKYPVKGTYLYVLELKSEEDGSTGRISGKIIIR